MRAGGPVRGRGALAFLLVIAFLLAPACNQAAKELRAALAGSRVVRFDSPDGVRLEGRLFGKGTVGVVLSHMLPADESSWYDFAGVLADQGYLVLTYDFRGYCPGGDAGCSRGTRDIAAIWQDVVGAVRFVRSQGATRLVLIGASMGGTASLVAAAQAQLQPAVIVTLSAPQSIQGLVAGPDVLAQIDAAKLFIAGEFDPTGAAASAQQMAGESPAPKRVEIRPTGDHGTDLLTGGQGEIVRKLTLDYLAQYASPG